jgi:hypothetical protein
VDSVEGRLTEAERVLLEGKKVLSCAKEIQRRLGVSLPDAKKMIDRHRRGS